MKIKLFNHNYKINICKNYLNCKQIMTNYKLIIIPYKMIIKNSKILNMGSINSV